MAKPKKANSKTKRTELFAPAGRSGSHAKPRRGLRLYALRHIQACQAALRQMQRTPFTTAMILIVIGIALALPASLFALLQNVEQLGKSWDKGTQISLYLRADVDSQQAQSLLAQIQALPGVGNADYISPDQGLAEFEQQQDLQTVDVALPNNPLPGVIVVKPALHLNTSSAIAGLVDQLRALPEVDTAQLDMQWIQRLFAMVALAQEFVWVLSSLLGIGVLLVVGNTIHLSMQNYQHEIKVFKLVGATNAFIRRPFLYTGLLYGLLGAVLAWMVVSLMLWPLSSFVGHLASLYQSHFTLHSLELPDAGFLLLAGALLGLIGAQAALARYLRSA